MLQQQAQQRNALLEHQAAQRRARKPTDLNLPDGLDEIVIGDGVEQYKKLRVAEKRLDYVMMRKRLEIQDSLARNVKRQKTLRIWITNTCSGQSWQREDNNEDEDGFTFESGPDPTYHVVIKGRLLEYQDEDLLHSDDEDEDEPVNKQGKDGERQARGDAPDDDHEMADAQPPKRKERVLVPPSKKFTHFFKAMTVDFDNPNNPMKVPGDPNMTVEWKKGADPRFSGDYDRITFERKADENINITIALTRDEQPERYKLSPELADLLDMEEADRAEVVMGIWDYVRAMGLQEDEERRSIQCDEPLKRVFGTDTFFFPQAAERIIPHLLPLEPIRLRYTIRLDKDFHEKQDTPIPTIYDVKVLTEDPLRALYLKMTQNPEHINTLQQIKKIDDELAVIIQAIHHHKARWDFFKACEKDPINFMKNWLSSQKRDLSIIMGEADRGDVAGMEFAGSDVWNSEAVREAVRYRLARAEAQQAQAGPPAPAPGR
jgi:SWI/SNF-related matrix-associated actin-dependent regulator of chromatin subfamily D